MLRFVLLLALLATYCVAVAGPSDPALERGKALVGDLCSTCHAIGASGQSAHVGAPAFRNLDRRVDLDSLFNRLRQGLTSDSHEMPTFRFRREDARALIAYLRSIRSP